MTLFVSSCAVRIGAMKLYVCVYFLTHLAVFFPRPLDCMLFVPKLYKATRLRMTTKTVGRDKILLCCLCFIKHVLFGFKLRFSFYCLSPSCKRRLRTSPSLSCVVLLLLLLVVVVGCVSIDGYQVGSYNRIDQRYNIDDDGDDEGMLEPGLVESAKENI